MTLPLVVLAVLSTLGGLVGVPYALSSLVGAGDVNYFEHTLEPVIAGHAGPAADHGAHATVEAATHGDAHDTHAATAPAAAESGPPD